MKKFLLVLCLILSINAVSFATFSDVKTYTEEIEYLTSKGIINGYDDNTFRPDNKITRAELVKMVVIATQKTKTKINNFSDVANNHWAKEYIDIAVANDFIKGDTEGTFRPEDNITYGEVSTVLVRVMGKENNAEKIDLQWPLNYMREAEELELFNGYATNDLVADAEARRDNVALMIYNMLTLKGEIKEETEKESTEKIDTKTSYAGFVKSVLKSKAEDYIKLEEGNNELKLSSKSSLPEVGSFIAYQYNSKGEINIRRELTLNDMEENYLIVESVDDEIVKLKDEDVLLDLELDKFTYGDKTYKLNKINFITIMYDKDDNKFTDYQIVAKSKLKLKKDDKIKFDETLNICYVIRED